MSDGRYRPTAERPAGIHRTVWMPLDDERVDRVLLVEVDRDDVPVISPRSADGRE